MTNLERLEFNGSNCPYEDVGFVYEDINECQKPCPEICKQHTIDKLKKTAKGRRWLESEA